MAPRCPLTAAPHSPAEQLSTVPAVRCFKLGRGRRSYNDVRLKLTDGSGRTAALQQCVHIPAAAEGSEAQESCITYQVGLPGGRSLLCRMFLVFDEPRAVEAGQADAAAGAAGGEVAGDSGGGRHYCWRLVSRADCAKGCQGPILATSRRLSSLGKRRADGSGTPPGQGAKAKADKHASYMYVSIDEPCTHCGASAFRLVAGIYETAAAAQPQHPAAPASSGAHSAAGPAGQGPAAATLPAAAERLLATAVSPPIKVLANNDVSTGPGSISLQAALPADWEGWADPAVWAGKGTKRPSAAIRAPAASEAPAASGPAQLRCKVRRACSEPSLAAGTDSCSPRSLPEPPPPAAAAVAPRAAASAPTRLAVEAWSGGGSQQELPVHVEVEVAPAPSPSLSAWQELHPPAAALASRSVTPVLLPGQQAQLPTAFGTVGTAPPLSLPSYSHQLPSAEAAAAAAAAAAAQQQQQQQQQQHARQPALHESASLPVLPAPLGSRSSGCVPPLEDPVAAHLRKYHSCGAAVAAPPVARPAAAQERMVVPGGRAIISKVPGGYRVVRARGQPSSTPSPFVPPRGALPPSAASYGAHSAAAPGYGGAAAPAVLLAPHAPANGHPHSMSAVSLPPAAGVAHSWAELQSSASTPQPPPPLLPGERGAAVASAAPIAWPMQPARTPPTAHAWLGAGSAADGSSGVATTAAGWDASQWAAYQAAAMRHSEVQLIAAGLAAAGRLGLLPHAAGQLAPAPAQQQQLLPDYTQAAAEQQAAAYRQAAAYQQALQAQQEAAAWQQAAAFQEAHARQQAAEQQTAARQQAAEQQTAARQQAAYQQGVARQQARAQQLGAARQAAAQPQAAAGEQLAPAHHARAAAPELPSEAELLGLMLDGPNDFESMVSSLFDDAPMFGR